MFEKAKKIVKDSMDFEHDCKNGPDSACQSCYKATQEIEALDRESREICAGLTAIRQFAKDIRKFPTDTRGVVDYSTGRIIAIVDQLTGAKEDNGNNSKTKRS